MIILAIQNPISGKNNKDDQISKFKEIPLGIRYHTTTKERNATTILHGQENEPNVIIISGGDGTISEVIQAVHDKDFSSKLMIIPSGTTNEIASNLNIKNTFEDNLNLLLDYDELETLSIDYGLINDSLTFTYSLSFGSFTHLTYKTPQKLKNVFGYLAYVLYGFLSFRGIENHELTISYDTIEIKDNFTFGGITNSKTLGGVINLSPFKPSLNDGEFEVILIKTPRRIKDYWNILKSIAKSDFSNDSFIHFKTRELSIKSKKGIKWNIDGEYSGEISDLFLRNIKEKIKIIK